MHKDRQQSLKGHPQQHHHSQKLQQRPQAPLTAHKAQALSNAA
jgi:hypothetical protein